MAKAKDKEVIQTYTKAEILKAEKYKHSKDLINALLMDNEFYSLDDVEKKLEEFLKGEVK